MLFLFLRPAAFLACLGMPVCLAPEKTRLLIMSDIGNEVDDQQSFVHALMYGDKYEFEGFIATTSCHMKTRVKPQLFAERIKAYGQVRANLLKHSPDFPDPASLQALVKSGQTGFGMAAVGDKFNTAGSDQIIAAVDKNDPRPLYIVAWGGTNTLAQALWRVKKERPADEVRKFVAKIRVFEDAGQDDAGPWATHTFPDLFWVRNQTNDKAISPAGYAPAAGGDPAAYSDAWAADNIQNGHGPLGALYPNRIWVMETDSPTFMGLILNGLNGDMYDSVWFGGWGGRHSREKLKNAPTGSGAMNVGLENQWRDWYMFNDAADHWTFNGTTYDNVYCALFRWRTDYANDFAARMDWCVKNYQQANHNPRVVVNGDKTLHFIRLTCPPGRAVNLDAAGTSDPDKNSLEYSWWIYREPGTYAGTVQIANAASSKATVTVPADIGTRSFHVILTVKDNGMPHLYGYRRVIITGGTTPQD